jgi:hypothetical protein
VVSAAGVYGQLPGPEAFGPPEAAEKRWFEEMYLAKDDGKGSPGEPATGFMTTDVPIHCVVVLTGASTVSVRMNLVAIDVSGVKPETRVVSTSYTTKDNQDRVNFSGRPERLWFAGRYRADIFINDTLVKKLEFEIRKPIAPAKSALGYQLKQPAKQRPKRN